MSRIEAFSPEREGIADKHNLEEKMVKNVVISPSGIEQNNAITQKEIEDYADFIVNKANSLKDDDDEDEKTSFVVDALSEENIKDELSMESWAKELTLEEVRGAINRVRQALIEKLKGKVDGEIYLVIKDLGFAAGSQNIIEEIVSVTSGKRNVFKQLAPDTFRSKSDKEDATEAAEKFIDLMQSIGQHPNFVKIIAFDPEEQRAIYEKLDMVLLNEFLRKGSTTREKFLVAIRAIEGCLVAAEYLESQDLILQDLKPSNIGLTSNDGSQGVKLFDLERISNKGADLSERRYAKDYELPKADRSGLAKPSEMTFQLGICLGKVLAFIYQKRFVFRESDGKTLSDLGSLCEKMTRPSASERIGLSEAKTELEAIVREFEKTNHL